PDRAGQRRQRLEIGANLVGIGEVVDVGMRGAFERRVGDRWQDAPEFRSRLFVAQYTPESRMCCGDKHQNGDDGAHRNQTMGGEQGISGPDPEVRPIQRQFNITLPRDLTTHMTSWPFQGLESGNGTGFRSFRRDYLA